MSRLIFKSTKLSECEYIWKKNTTLVALKSLILGTLYMKTF